jgi:hypothetical protein
MSSVTNDDSSSEGDEPASYLGPPPAQPPLVAPDAPMVTNYATINVSSHVPVKLELRSSNYTQWKSLFQSLCGKFGLLAHINGTAAPDLLTDAWLQANSCVRSWRMAPSIPPSSTSPWCLTRLPINSGRPSRTTSRLTRHPVPSSQVIPSTP